MPTFLHTADWQLGKPFARVEEESKRALLQQERIEVLRRIGTLARERKAAFVLVAGDLFDSTTPSKSTVAAACSAIKEIGVPVYAIPGNHDHGGVGSVWTQPFFELTRQQLAPNLHLLLEPKPIELDSAILLPCPLLRRHEVTDPTAWLRDPEVTAALPADKPRIVLAHGSIQGFGSQDDDDDSSGGGNGAPANIANFLDINRLPAGACDYLALGDWHGMKEITPSAWYAGTPERDRFPKGEGNLPGHVLCVTVERGATPVVEPVVTARFGWHHIAQDFQDDADVEACATRVEELLAGRSGADLLRLELSGRLGMDAMTRLETLLELWQSRLLRLKLANDTRLAPSEAEVEALTRRTGDPLISRVATRLVALTRGADENAAAVARVALRELHANLAGASQTLS